MKILTNAGDNWVGSSNVAQAIIGRCPPFEVEKVKTATDKKR